MKQENSPSWACKNAGLKSLRRLSQITGQSEQTLSSWFSSKKEHRRRQFRDALNGALAEEGKVGAEDNGEMIDVDSLVRHYLTEFIKHSAR